MMESYPELAIKDLDDLVFGKAPRPLTLPRGLTIGGGDVYPELNFTLPPMDITEDTMSQVREQYSMMIEDACRRAAELEVPGLVVEFETLPELTLNPHWAASVTEVLRAALDRFEASDGIKTALRVTPNDIREFVRPPLQREGEMWDRMVSCFDLCAQSGGDLLAIESTGGKELHDDAIVTGDLAMSVFSLGVLGAWDMEWVWDMIVGVAERNRVVAAGDTACGFANTAMVLADGGQVPRVWAAVIRALTIPRSLVAYERGAVGPGKDCGYENVYLKAITGYPMALEGAESSCAHLSPIGNVAKATADLWSNESVQNIKLLGGMAPTVSVEQLTYAVRLFNEATRSGQALVLRDLFSASDVHLDPQAYILQPEVALRIAGEIVAEETAYGRTRRAALAVLDELRKGETAGEFNLTPPEKRWLRRLSSAADELPEDEGEFVASVLPEVDESKVRLSQYGIKV